MRRRSHQNLVSFLASILCLTLFVPTAFATQLFPLVPPIEIVIDPGHGGVDSGATYVDIEEKKVNLLVAQKLRDQLVRQGYRVVLTRERDEALSESSPRTYIGSRHRRDLVQRGDIVAHFAPKIIVSLHTNSGSETKRGGQVFYQASGQGYLLADIMQDKLNKVAKVNERPLPNRSLYILNRSKSIALLVELGYLSNPSERTLLLRSDYQQSLADGIARAIDEFMLIFPWSITSR